MEVDVDKSHPIVNRMIKDIPFPDDAIVSCILRNHNAIITKGNTLIEVNDRLIIMSDPKVQSDVLKLIRGRID